MTRNTEKLLGRVIGERYQLRESLAKGGMGSILLGTQINLNRKVAVKIIHQALSDKNLSARFRREAEALAAVVHPSIVQIYDFIEEDDAQFLIMEFVAGRNLKEYIADPGGDGLSIKNALSMVTPICSALVEIHGGGLLHRDIKPANIIRYMRADKSVGVKLVDFGIARRTDDLGLTSDGYVVGTPQYLSPEVLLGKKHSPASDVYALGITFCELATGIRPFDSDELHEIIKQRTESDLTLPPALKGTPAGTLLGYMLERDETARPSAAQVLSGLEAIQELLSSPQGHSAGHSASHSSGHSSRYSSKQANKRSAEGSAEQSAEQATEQPTARFGSKAGESAHTPSASSFSPTVLQTPTKKRAAQQASDSNHKAGGPVRLVTAGLIGAAVAAAVLLFAVWAWKDIPGDAKKGASIRGAQKQGTQSGGDSAGGGESASSGGGGEGKSARAGGQPDKSGQPVKSGQPAQADSADETVKTDQAGKADSVADKAADKTADKAADETGKPEDGKELPSIRTLVSKCTTTKEGIDLYNQARKAQEAGKVEFAKRAFHAIIQSKGAARAQRKWAAHRLTKIYIRENSCAGARRVWESYQIFAGKKQRFPGCP